MSHGHSCERSLASCGRTLDVQSQFVRKSWQMQKRSLEPSCIHFQRAEGEKMALIITKLTLRFFFALLAISILISLGNCDWSISRSVEFDDPEGIYICNDEAYIG